jgi:hypothetical protein
MPEIFEQSFADYLLVADKPITQSDVTIERLSRNEIAERFHFHYSENVHVGKAAQKNASREKVDSTIVEVQKKLLDATEARLRNPFNDSLVVCAINDKVGSGVFTTKPINCGTVISVYAGQHETQRENGDYFTETKEYASLAISLEKIVEKILITTQNNDYNSNAMGDSARVNAGFVGGIARFIQHMPTDIERVCENIDNADLSTFLKIASSYGQCFPESETPPPAIELFFAKERVKEHIRGVCALTEPEPKIKRALNNPSIPIASANTVFVDFIYKGVKVQAVVAIRDIEANEQLGIDYGTYWKSREQKPEYFDKNTGYVLAPEVLFPQNNAKKAISASALAAEDSTAFRGFGKGFLGEKKKISPQTAPQEKGAAAALTLGVLTSPSNKEKKPLSEHRQIKNDSGWKSGFLK